MPSSNIIRGRQAEAHIKPARFEEIGAETGSRGDGVHPESNVIRHASEISLLPLRLFKDYVQSPPQDVMSPAAGTVRPDRAGRCAERPVSMPQAGHETDNETAAEERATAILRQAQADADRCLEAARENAAALETEAYTAGRQEGEQTARKEFETRFNPVLAGLQNILTDITGLRRTILHQAEQDIIDLAFQLAKKIVQCEVLANPEVVAATLRRALAHVVADDSVVVRVNPIDLELARQLREDLLHDLGAIRQLTIEGDATIGRGGCVVESTLGEIDARIEAQIEELEHRFREQYDLTSEANLV